MSKKLERLEFLIKQSLDNRAKYPEEYIKRSRTDVMDYEKQSFPEKWDEIISLLEKVQPIIKTNAAESYIGELVDLLNELTMHPKFSFFLKLKGFIERFLEATTSYKVSSTFKFYFYRGSLIYFSRRSYSVCFKAGKI